MHKKVKLGRTFVGRFKAGDDLLGALQSFCEKQGIRLGAFQLIGALKSIRLGYYDQIKKRYVYCVSIRKKLEITACSGNISLKDGKIFVHAHINAADLKGKTYGGHLLEGSEVFAAEFVVQELAGAILKRIKDPATGLPLWG